MYYNTISESDQIGEADMIWGLDGAESIHNFDALPRLVTARYKDA